MTPPSMVVPPLLLPAGVGRGSLEHAAIVIAATTVLPDANANADLTETNAER